MSGTYTATLTDNTTGCSTPQTVTINVIPINGGCLDDIICYANVNNEGWQQTCNAELSGGQSVSFGPQLTNNNLQGSWSWTGPGGFTSGSREITVSNPGNYEVVFSAADGCVMSQTIGVSASVNETISGTVWVDTNADGIRNPGEAGIPGVTVRLFFDNNEDGFVERIVSTVQSGSNGSYALQLTMPGKYQIGIDPLSLPQDKYRLTAQDASGDDTVDNDVSPHTFRTEIFESNPGNIDIGILQGSGDLIFIGNGEVVGEPVHRWIYQDIHFQIQDTGLDPNDANYRAIIDQWVKWYAVGERITQEAEVLPGYLNLARHNHVPEAGVTVKHFHTVNSLGSYASGRGAVSSGIPAETLLNNPDVVVDHILMFYETTRGANPIWKYRANWPFGGRLTHHALTSMTLKELGGFDALMQAPNVTAWNPGRDHLNELSRWESAGLSFAQGFPIDPNLIEGTDEFVNQASIQFPNPDNPAQMTGVSSRGLQTAIIIKILADMGRETAMEVFHNMSAKSWYSPSQDQALIHFKQAVNDATDGVYNNDFSQKWGFPAENTYNDTRTVNSGSFTNRQEYKWDLKPHNYDPVKIRPGYEHLSDRTTQGYIKWIDADSSSFRNLGAIDYLAPQGDITYPNENAHVVIGEGVNFAHQLPNGEWLLELNIKQGSADAISFTDGELIERNGNTFSVLIEDGEMNMSFNGQVRISEMTLLPNNSCANGGPTNHCQYTTDYINFINTCDIDVNEGEQRTKWLQPKQRR